MLSRRIVLIVLGVLLLTIVLDYIIVYTWVSPKFLDLEMRAANENVNRIIWAIDREVFHLQTFLSDWATWDDTYRFIQNGNQTYIDANLSNATFDDNDLSLILFVDRTGTIVWGKNIVDSLRSPESLGLVRNGKLRQAELLTLEAGLFRSGLYRSEMGLMMISSAPVIKTDKSGPAAGSLIMGKMFDDVYLDQMMEQTGVGFSLVSAVDGMTPGKKRILDELHIGSDYVLQIKHRTTLEGFRLLKDVFGRDLIIIRTETPRDMTAQGREMIHYIWLSLFAVGAVILLVLLLILRRMVLLPLNRLKKHVLKTGESDVAPGPIMSERGDEIGILAREFDKTFDKLFRTRTRLLEMSYKAGISEMASVFLHNLRNTITPITVGVQSLEDRIRNIDFVRMETVVEELGSDQVDPLRKNDLREYLRLSLNRERQSVTDIIAVLNDLRETTRNIETLLDYQEQWSHAQPVIEEVTIRSIVDEVRNFLPQAGQTIQLDIQYDLPPENSVRIHKIPLMMVLSSLVKYCSTIIDSGADPMIHVSLIPENGSGTKLHIHIGCNSRVREDIDLDDLFSRSSSTEAQVDLHWCANVVSSLGGSIAVHFDKVTCLFTFDTLIPVQI